MFGAGIRRLVLLTIASLVSAASFAQTVHAAEVAQADPGSAGYQTYCASCHQPDGQGMAGAFPPLAGSDYLLEDPSRGISAVLEGVVQFAFDAA